MKKAIQKLEKPWQLKEYGDIWFRKENKLWMIKETTHYVFHFEPNSIDAKEIDKIAEKAEERFAQIIRCLQVPKESELGVDGFKINCFLYAEPQNAGQVVGSGIDYGAPMRGEHMRHEECHAIVKKLVGEAPALFNEGLGSYLMGLSRTSQPPVINTGVLLALEKKELPSLKSVIKTNDFWRAYNERKVDVYQIGDSFVAYLIESYGIGKLKDLFLQTDYNDNDIECKLEEAYQKTIESLEQEWHRYLKGEK
ncbi:TPA: hypothetical protein EYP66_08800 [Candidatus Poribacteria bacterium]|nr:hypothetical protein [Candidatus Poribacteria bacterium]